MKQFDDVHEERWFQAIVEASPHAMILIDQAQRIAFVNRGAETLFGYGRKELTGREVEALIPAQYRERYASRVSEFFGEPKPDPIKTGRRLFGRRKDGSEISIEIGLDPIEAPGGCYMLASIIDISGRLRQEEAFRLAVEAAPNAMVMVDSSRTIALVNRSAEALFGYTRDELLGHPIESLVPDRFRAHHPAHAAKFLGESRPRPMRAGRDLFGCRKDGSEVPIEIGLNAIETSEGRFTLASIVDITERLRYEDALRRSSQEAIEEKQQAEDCALLLLRLWDQIAALAIRCGLPGAEAAPALVLDACRDPSHVEESLAAVLATFETAFCGYADANRKLAAQNVALIAAKAVTEASNRELEAFSYSVAHDLRAPLRSINGFSQILEEEYASRLDEAGRGYLGRVRCAAQQMGTLIDDLLRLAGIITQGDLSCTSVNLSAKAAQIRDALCAGAPERAAEFIIEPDLVVNGSPRLLRDVLENLLSNAWKFTANEPMARIEFGSELIGGETVFYVRDNGAGFDMAHAGKLFRAFQRLHNVREFPGSGIGLATVQRIVNKHGGRIWAEAELGKGATFRFVL